MVDDAEAMRERRKATRQRGNTHDGDPVPQVTLPAPEPSAAPAAKSAAADLVAQLSVAPAPAAPGETSFDLDGLDLGPMEPASPSTTLPPVAATRPHNPLSMELPTAVGRTAKPEEAENLDDDFGGSFDDLHLPGEDGPAAAAPAHAAPASGGLTPVPAAPRPNWTDEFDLPDGSLKLRISPFREGGVTPQSTPQKLPAPTHPAPQPPAPRQQQQQTRAPASSQDSDDGNWGAEFDLPDGSLRLKMTPTKPAAAAAAAPALTVRQPPQAAAAAAPTPLKLHAPQLSRHMSTRVTAPRTRPHAASIASRDETPSDTSSTSSEDSHKGATGKLPSPLRSPLSRQQLLATLEAAAASSAPRQEGDEDTWAEFDFAALSGKREDGGEVQLQLRPVVASAQAEDDGNGADEPEWGDEEDEEDRSGELGEEIRGLREEQATLQADISSAFTAVSRQGAPDAFVLATLAKLIKTLQEHAGVKGRVIQQTGAAALADLLENASRKPDVLVASLRAVNELVKECPEAQTLFAVAGGVALVLSFATAAHREDTRVEVARFISLTPAGQPQETLVACRGPQALVHLLVGGKGELAKLAVAGIHTALDLQSGRACGDVGRAFVRAGLLPALVATARANVADEALCTVIGSVFLSLTGAGGASGAYSGVGADDAVRAALCVNEVIAGILDLVPKAPEQLRVALLKTIKLAASDPSHSEVLRKAGAIEVLLKELPREGGSAAARYNALVALSQLCKLNPERQAAAAKLGIVPHLLTAAGNRALKEVAIPMLCDLLRVKPARSEMWKNNCLLFFLDLLRDRIYQPNALESIAFWLLDEPRNVKAIIGHKKQLHKLGRAFEKSDNAVWPRLVGPYLRIATKSRAIARRLVREDVFVGTLLAKLSSPLAKADVKKDMLLILKRLVAVHRERHAFVTQYGLVSKLTALRRESQTSFILVTIIDELLASISK